MTITIVLYLALLAVAFFILIVRPQRRQMAARRALIASLEVGDEVITAGGIYGTILEITDLNLRVEVAPGVVLTLAREAVTARPVPAASPDEELDDEVPAEPGEDD
jgi:preprotein translocase subunit YajC